jgi:branched-chain amino acid transport system ATP-binding protein
MLEATRLVVAHGDAVALWDASLAVGPDELVAVVGPNGSGKTTLINAIAGLLPVRDGQLRFRGQDLTRLAPHEVCRHGIAVVPEGRRLFGGMTVEENLEIGCYAPAARSARTAGLERAYATFPVLRHRRRQLAGSLSGGEQQMAAIARALMAGPRLLLLDEPSLGLAPAVVATLFGVIGRLHREGVAILLVEQNVAQALSVATRAYVLEEGRTVAEGSPGALRADPRVRQAYLGQPDRGPAPG